MMYPPGIPVDVCQKFEELALKAHRSGFAKYSARTVLEIIRWHYTVDRGMSDFKCNDHWSPYLARWFLKKHPDYSGFFELRERNEQGWGRDWSKVDLGL